MSAAKDQQGGSGGESGIVLYAALAANIGVAVAKFVAALLTGSSSMLTEAFHSTVDSLNQILMLYGQRRARRPADDIHPIGYGRELYFWSFVVAILIFATGAGLSVLEGISHVRSPEQPSDLGIAYGVLGVAALFEGTSWGTAVRAFSHEKGKGGWWAAIRRSKDPRTFIVLFEDSAALLGLAIAALGIFLAHWTGDGRWDGYASILIGGMLGVVAILLARESKGLLIGERADPALSRAIREGFEARAEVTSVKSVVTVQLSPDAVLAACVVDFEDEVKIGRIEAAIAEVERDLRGAWPMMTSLYVKPNPELPVEART